MQYWDGSTLPGGAGESFSIVYISHIQGGLTVHHYRGVSTNYDQDCGLLESSRFLKANIIAMHFLIEHSFFLFAQMLLVRGSRPGSE